MIQAAPVKRRRVTFETAAAAVADSGSQPQSRILGLRESQPQSQSRQPQPQSRIHRCMSMFEQVSKSTLDAIMELCVVSPTARHNGIAVCSRMTNIAWRKMHRRFARKWINDSINYALSRNRSDVDLLGFIELADFV